MAPRRLSEIADRIARHLFHFEADPTINMPLFHANAFQSGRWVYVQYVSYQGEMALNRTEAECYLDWLDAGNIGKHWTALNAAKDKVSQ